jgi:NAD(P)-dependent dehydrogenase (short-subunit alcohol dehydrogenase family)
VSTDLEDKVVWVTGGAKGLGRALALAFAKEGADIAFSYHSSSHEAEQTENQIQASGVRCLAIQTDLRRVNDVRAAAKRIDETFGRIDVLINNAGVFVQTPVDEMTEEQVDEMLDVNLKAMFFTCQEAARRMKRQGQGSILNVSSVGGLVPWSSYPVYCASRAAVLMATRSIALALAPQVRVNSIAPGILTVPKGMSGEEAEQLKSRIPMRAFGRFDDVVDAALFLTKSGHYITGETLVVDGGRQLK